ncbi:replication stress response regulator SDE2-like [Dreissena polymorpha]|uniref:replication stress response regulator SDE2-like n=1 Tax=Dreissena polymorpha TaxID=45954 RepID=UPI002264A0AD|nr:replication stress response regulator SDE2-like [Dreissena polymorpha]
MSTFVYNICSRHTLCVNHNEFKNVLELKHFITQQQIGLADCFLTCNGAIVADDEPVRENVVYQTCFRIPGGKGGFGSMLRAIGAQIEKTTNHEACRDLSGRRMRDVNNEKDLKDWLAKQADREREKEEKRQERLARRRALPNHKFEDPTYEQQRSQLAENLDDALQTGLKKLVPKPGTSCTVTLETELGTKRKNSSLDAGPSKKKKDVEWLGINVDISDLDSGEDDQSEDSKGEATGGPNSEDSSGARNSDSNQAGDNSNDGKTELGREDQEEPCAEKTDVQENKSKMFISEECTGVQKPTEIVTLELACSAEHLQRNGLEWLKQELMERGLKCGGTLEERAHRLFSVKGLSRDQIDPALFAKASKTAKNKNNKNC